MDYFRWGRDNADRHSAIQWGAVPYSLGRQQRLDRVRQRSAECHHHAQRGGCDDRLHADEHGVGSAQALKFTGSGGATFTKNLVGNIDIRDFNTPTEFTDRINNTTTINAWTGPLYEGNSFHRLDQQIITLPAAFATQTLTSVTITDTGRDNFQHAILAAMTIDGVALATDHLIT